MRSDSAPVSPPVPKKAMKSKPSPVCSICCNSKVALVTIDAAGTWGAIAEKIHEAGADYVLSLKANQKNTLAAVASHCRGPARSTPELYLAGKEPWPLRAPRALHERLFVMVPQKLEVAGTAFRGPGAARHPAHPHRPSPHRSTLLSLHHPPPDAKRLATLVRHHWSVENRCHWVLDVVFGENHCQVRDAAAAHHLSLLRETALKALRNEPSRDSLRSKPKRASLDPAFRLNLLLALQA